MESFENNLKSPRKVGVFRLSTILALVAILPLSTLMAGLLNSRHAASTLGNNSVQQQVDNGNTAVSRDYSELAGKYIGLFVANDNGTVTLDIGNKANRAVIEAEDLQALQEYAEMIERVNALVEDGTLYIAEDGNYYLVGKDFSSRSLVGGRNDFWVRTEEFWLLFFSVWLPVGYHIELGATNAIIFGAVSGFFAFASTFIANSYDKFVEYIKKEGMWTAGDITAEAAPDDLGVVVDTLKNIWSIVSVVRTIKEAIKNLMKADAISAIVGVIVDIILNLIWGSTGLPFLVKGLQCAITSDNTVIVEPNLIFLSSNSWTARY